MKIFLVLFFIFNGPDKAPVEQEMVVRGTIDVSGEKTPFPDLDACEKKYDEFKAAAEKDPNEVRSIGHACVQFTPEEIGRGV